MYTIKRICMLNTPEVYIVLIGLNIGLVDEKSFRDAWTTRNRMYAHCISSIRYPTITDFYRFFTTFDVNIDSLNCH